MTSPSPETEKPRGSRKPPLAERLQILAVQSAFRVGSLVAPERVADQALKFFMTPTRIPRPGWETELVKSARRLEFKSGLIGYAWGRGPRVLLVHGWDGRGTQMGRIATAIADAGYEAICLDLPGHGESPGKLVHVPMVAEALRKTGGELGLLHAVVGHSFGAGTSLYAIIHGFEVGRVVYISGSSRFDTLFDRYCGWVKVWGRARERFDEKLRTLVGVDPYTAYPAVWATKVDLPALIIHDRSDDECPFAEGEEMHRHWVGSRFFPTSGLGHRRILKAKEVIAETVAFLSQKPPTPQSR